MSTTFMKVQDVADELGVSKSYAYKIVQKLNDELKAHALTMKLNINAGRLYNEYGIRYENKRCHDGRKVRLYLEQA